MQLVPIPMLKHSISAMHRSLMVLLIMKFISLKTREILTTQIMYIWVLLSIRNRPTSLLETLTATTTTAVTMRTVWYFRSLPRVPQ